MNVEMQQLEQKKLDTVSTKYYYIYLIYQYRLSFQFTVCCPENNHPPEVEYQRTEEMIHIVTLQGRSGST